MSDYSIMNFVVPRFDNFNMPEGWLTDEPACHALFYYATLCAQHEQAVRDNQTYEDELSAEGRGFDYSSLMKSIGQAYGAEPEKMVKFWHNVDMQFDKMGGRRLPAKYRMVGVPDIKTKGWGNL